MSGSVSFTAISPDVPVPCERVSLLGQAQQGAFKSHQYPQAGGLGNLSPVLLVLMVAGTPALTCSNSVTHLLFSGAEFLSDHLSLFPSKAKLVQRITGLCHHLS